MIEDNFIGQEFVTPKGGILKVVGKSEKSLYKLSCSICSEDKELFSDPVFYSYRFSLKDGSIPCGCGLSPKWNEQQNLIRAKRSVKDSISINGYSEEYKGNTTRIECVCKIDNHVWYPEIRHIINKESGCPRCSSNFVKDQEDVENFIKEKLQGTKYNFIGFKNGYVNCYSKFQYECTEHGVSEIALTNFRSRGRATCKECSKAVLKQKSEELYGHYPERDKELDNLYVLSVNDNVIKIGRSFDIKRRLRELKRYSKSSDIKVIESIQDTHDQIYYLEQYIHKELKSLGLHKPTTWSTECFDIRAKDHINELIKSFKSDREG